MLNETLFKTNMKCIMPDAWDRLVADNCFLVIDELKNELDNIYDLFQHSKLDIVSASFGHPTVYCLRYETSYGEEYIFRVFLNNVNKTLEVK